MIPRRYTHIIQLSMHICIYTYICRVPSVSLLIATEPHLLSPYFQNKHTCRVALFSGKQYIIFLSFQHINHGVPQCCAKVVLFKGTIISCPCESPEYTFRHLIHTARGGQGPVIHIHMLRLLRTIYPDRRIYRRRLDCYMVFALVLPCVASGGVGAFLQTTRCGLKLQGQLCRDSRSIHGHLISNPAHVQRKVPAEHCIAAFTAFTLQPPQLYLFNPKANAAGCWALST